jgi:hypothetical protein
MIMDAPRPPGPPIAAMLDAEGRLAVDAPCVGCGYNLRTLKPEAVCPECAQSVAYSIRGYFLRSASPGWVRDLARGSLLVLIALGGMIVLGPAISLALFMPAIMGGAPGLAAPPTQLLDISAGWQFTYSAVCTTLAVIGLVWLTRRDPASAQGAGGLTARRLIRVSCFLLPSPVVINFVLVLCMPALPTYTPGAPPSTPAAFGPGFATFIGFGLVSGIVGFLIYAITPVALTRYLAGLLRRLPRPGLVRFARIESWGLLVSTAGLLCCYVLIALLMVPALGPLMAVATSLPTSAPSGMATATYYTWPGGTVSITQSTAPATTPSGLTPADIAQLTAMGYLSSAPATSTTSAPATLPARPFLRPPRGFFAGFALSACVGGLSGCGTVGFGIAAIVLLAMSCAALFHAAREAEQNAALAQPAPQESNARDGPNRA